MKINLNRLEKMGRLLREMIAKEQVNERITKADEAGLLAYLQKKVGKSLEMTRQN